MAPVAVGALAEQALVEVIGTDAGGLAALPVGAQQLIRVAALVAAPQRLLAELPPWWQQQQAEGRIPATSPCPERLASDRPEQMFRPLEQALASGRPALVLASGDPLWFGIGRLLIQRFGAQRLRFHPAPSSLQLAFARLGLSLRHI